MFDTFALIKILEKRVIKSYLNNQSCEVYTKLFMEKLISAIETGSVDKVKEVLDSTAVSPTACSEVS